MTTTLKSIVRFDNVAPGATVSLPHGLIQNGVPLVPDEVKTDNRYLVPQPTPTTTSLVVAVTNVSDTPQSGDVLCEWWHTFERAFGRANRGFASDAQLTPAPFIPSGTAQVDLDEKVKVSGDDTTADFLEQKVVAGQNIALATLNPGANEQLQIIGGGGLGNGGSVLIWGNDNLSAAADTRFLWPGFSNQIAELISIAGFRLPRIGTLRNFRVRHNRANGNGNPVAYDILVNGVPQALGLSLVTGAIGDAGPVAANIAVNPGDLLEVTASKAAAIGGASLGIVFCCELF